MYIHIHKLKDAAIQQKKTIVGLRHDSLSRPNTVDPAESPPGYLLRNLGTCPISQ